MRTGARFTLIAVVLGAGIFAAWRRSAVEAAERLAAIETSLLRSWARSETGAGVSILPIRVPRTGEKALRALEDIPGFHEYAMRCSSCHELPDPAAYTAKHWIGKVDQMRGHIDRAGVMPPPQEELSAVTEFLGRASRTLRGEPGGT